VIDKNRANRALRRSLIALGAIATLIVPALASAAVFEGSQTDPAGDVVIIPSPRDGNGQLISPPPPTRSGFGSGDLSNASVRYDSTLGELTISLTGINFVLSHSGTSFSGGISVNTLVQSNSPGYCGYPADVSDLTFRGSSGASGRGSGTLYGGILDDGALTVAAQILPAGYYPANPQTIIFAFKSPRLAGRIYRCASNLQATYMDSGNTTDIDGITPFCLVAGCFDQPVSAGPPPPVAEPLLDLSPPTLNRTSFQPGDTIQARAELINTNASTVTAKTAIITARPPGSTHANGPVKFDFSNSAQDNIRLVHGDVWVGSGSFRLPSDAPLGRYDVYLTYQTADGVYHDGLSNSFDVTLDGSPLPFDTGPPTANGTVTDRPGAFAIDGRCSILPGKIKSTTARMRLMQRASHRGSKSHRRTVTRQVRVLASRRATQRATFKTLCS
jgi:hypothetical protein